ncbi:acyl carrier protein [Sphingobium olei]
MSDITERVIKVVVENMGVYPDQVTPEASFLKDLGCESACKKDPVSGVIGV